MIDLDCKNCDMDDCPTGLANLEAFCKSRYIDPIPYRNPGCAEICDNGYACSLANGHEGSHESHQGITTRTVARWRTNKNLERISEDCNDE